ncbi:helix-turn-helix domain-containing protein [Streptomyces dysideae]
MRSQAGLIGELCDVTVRDVIHQFNEIGLACLDAHRAGGRHRQASPEDEDFVVLTAATLRPVPVSVLTDVPRRHQAGITGAIVQPARIARKRRLYDYLTGLA